MSARITALEEQVAALTKRVEALEPPRRALRAMVLKTSVERETTVLEVDKVEATTGDRVLNERTFEVMLVEGVAPPDRLSMFRGARNAMGQPTTPVPMYAGDVLWVVA